MTQEAIFAGFGGQGVLSMGMILAYAGMMETKEVCWMPSYGPEMRGGTANAIVIVSDSSISSPIISTFDSAIALNQPSIDKFEDKVKPGGHIFYDVSNTIKPPTREDLNIHAIPASEEVLKLGNKKVLNMLMLGSFIKATNAVDPGTILKALAEVLPERYHKLIPINTSAFEIGMSHVN
jgi:2-oxoglutarate ferredoxin oxidoreductase subunit gamma